MRNNLLHGKHALLRREGFGGTLFFVKEGKRTYVNRHEFESIVVNNSLPESLVTELGISVEQVIVREPARLLDHNFSAPDTIFLEVTRVCNLTCTHCFNNSGKALPNQLTQTQLEAIIDDLAASGVQEIRFTGGEPMIFPGTIALIRRASSLGLRCSMGTNATLITNRKADTLKSAGLRTGIVSIDGLAERHDRIRGQNSFRLTLEGLERLHVRDIDVRVNVVVMRSTLSDLPRLLEMLIARRFSVFMRRLILSGRASGSSDEMISEREYVDLRIQMKPFLNDPHGFIDGHYMKEKGIVNRIPLPFMRKKCSAGHRGLIVLPDGKVQTCGFLGHLGETSIGTLPQESFAEIWNRLNCSSHITTLEENLAPYNSSTLGPKTNCLAVALAQQEPLVMLRRSTNEVSS